MVSAGLGHRAWLPKLENSHVVVIGDVHMADCVDCYVLRKEQRADTGHAGRYNGRDGTRGIDFANTAILVVRDVDVSGAVDGHAGWKIQGSRSSRTAISAIADRACPCNCVDYSGCVYFSDFGVAIVGDVNIP